MRFADAEQWLAAALLIVWLVAAGLSAFRQVPRVKRLSTVTLTGTGVAAGLFALQAGVVDAVADPDGISAADTPALQWLVDHRAPFATAAATAVSLVGGTSAMAVLAAVVVLVLWFRRRRWEAGVVAVATAGAAILVETLKNIYDRPRPPQATRLVVETNYSLPSGHALGSTVVLGIVAAVAVLVLRGTAARTTAVVLAAVLVVAVGLSRLYLGVHWLTDVLDGWLVGGAWLALCVTVLFHTRPVPLPGPDPERPAGDADLPGAAAVVEPTTEMSAGPAAQGNSHRPE